MPIHSPPPDTFQGVANNGVAEPPKLPLESRRRIARKVETPGDSSGVRPVHALPPGKGIAQLPSSSRSDCSDPSPSGGWVSPDADVSGGFETPPPPGHFYSPLTVGPPAAAAGPIGGLSMRRTSSHDPGYGRQVTKARRSAGKRNSHGAGDGSDPASGSSPDVEALRVDAGTGGDGEAARGGLGGKGGDRLGKASRWWPEKGVPGAAKEGEAVASPSPRLVDVCVAWVDGCAWGVSGGVSLR